MRLDLRLAHRKLERLSAQDVQILELERGAVCGHTCKVIVLDPPSEGPRPTVESLRDSIAARLDGAPRLRQRLVPTPLGAATPAWLDDTRFDVARHVTAVPTSGPVDWHGLEQIVARIQRERLDRDRPLWHLDVVERLEDGGMALIWRLHHCMADGKGSMSLCACVMWEEAPEPGASSPARWTPAPSPSGLELLALGLRDGVRGAMHLPSPLSAARAFGKLLSSLPVVTRELGRTATVTPFAHAVGPGRKVAFARAPLEECRLPGKAIDPAITVNDVVLAEAISGAAKERRSSARARFRG
jgi:diacylglycerol O-acyltransferase / wax synthase